MAIEDIVNSFFDLVKTGGSQNISDIQNLFVPDSPAPPGPANIGLTLPSVAGPQFLGQDGINDLFTTLSNSFSQYAFDPASQLLTDGASMIAVEATLTTGHLQNNWAPRTVRPSPPLSRIHPAGGQNTQLPVCAVFTNGPCQYLDHKPCALL